MRIAVKLTLLSSIMAKKKSKYRDVESMTDEEFEALTREIAGPRVEFHKPPCDPRYTERHDNPTPSGGDYSIAYYYDENGDPCEKANAEFVNIVEYNKGDGRINETYGMIGRISRKDS